MQNINCRSLIDNRDADFHQISGLIERIIESLNLFRTDQGHIKFQSFEISQQLVTPIQNLHHLFTALFKETESEASEEQRKYLIICERILASFYCHIQHFLELHEAEIKGPSRGNATEQAKEWAHEFYFNAMYELRTPASALKGYSQIQLLTFMGVDSPPFVPENQDKFNKISYWIDELWKFIDDLPNLWKANEQGDTAYR